MILAGDVRLGNDGVDIPSYDVLLADSGL